MSSEQNEEDPYAHAIKGPLKLKTKDKVTKKKHKKKKDKEMLVEVEKPTEEENTKVVYRTKAELAFERKREKLQMERIKQKASKTHKQRVEEFNRHLDKLTEHFDIPKVSWTK